MKIKGLRMMLPARWLRCCYREGLLLLILVYTLLLLHRTGTNPEDFEPFQNPEAKKTELESASNRHLRRVSNPRDPPDGLSELQRAEQEVGHLQARAEDVWQGCRQTAIPLSTALRRAEEAQKVSARLALQFRSEHQSAVAKRLVHLKDRNLTWCLLPKVVSTSWSRALQQVSGEGSDSEAPQVEIRMKHRPPSNQELPQIVGNSESFFFVRHPFERLVTAYRSKLEHTSGQHDGDYFYGLYGRKIVAKYRKLVDVVVHRNLKRVEFRGNSLIENYDSLGSVEENKISVKEVTQSGELFVGRGEGPKRNIDNNVIGDRHQQPLTRDPTFEEFVDYLLDTDPNQYDEHWMPAALYCDVCRLKYQFILKYEDFKLENEQFIRYLVAKGVLPKDFVIKWENKIGTDSSVAKRYMALIEPNKLKKLITKFEHDFRLFQYDPYSIL